MGCMPQENISDPAKPQKIQEGILSDIPLSNLILFNDKNEEISIAFMKYED